jgi:hypothetical protein
VSLGSHCEIPGRTSRKPKHSARSTSVTSARSTALTRANLANFGLEEGTWEVQDVWGADWNQNKMYVDAD